MASEMKIVLLICLLAICMAAVDAGKEDILGYSKDSCNDYSYGSSECEACCQNFKRIPSKPFFGAKCVCKETQASREAKKEAEALAEEKAKYREIYLEENLEFMDRMLESIKDHTTDSMLYPQYINPPLL